LRHLSTVFGLMPKRFDGLYPSLSDYFVLLRRFAWRSLWRCHGVPVHNASLIPDDNTIPEIQGTVHLGYFFGSVLDKCYNFPLTICFNVINLCLAPTVLNLHSHSFKYSSKWALGIPLNLRK